MSPTKQMDFESQITEAQQNMMKNTSIPVFQKEALELNSVLKKLKREQLEGLMKISPSLSMSVAAATKAFGTKENISRPAIKAYAGTVFKAIDLSSFNEADLHYTCTHLRILSGMYGILKPADLIEFYRLEMKTPLKVPTGRTLNLFWKEKVTKVLNAEEALKNKISPIINLASTEYMKAVDLKKIKNPLINMNFKEDVDGKLRTVGMYSKVSRGKMIRRIIIEKIIDPEILKSGDNNGYIFNSKLSSATDWIYVRKHK